MKIQKLINHWKDSANSPAQRLPENIQFPVNDICNSKCQMCDIWMRKKDYEITPDEVRKALSNPLYREVKGVGINGGEPTLRKDIGELVEAVVETLPQLRSISLITNGILLRKVTAGVDAIGQACKKNGKNIHFDVMVSLDGVGEVHDKVRQKEKNFESSVKLLEYVKESALVDSYRIGCTIIKENVYHVEDLLFWLMERNIYGRFRVGVPHQRLYSNDSRDAFQLDEDEKFHLANFLDYIRQHYESDLMRKDFLLSLRNQVIYGAPRKHGCAWKNRGVTLSSRGELAYCAVESKSLGSAVNEDSTELYYGNESHLKEIRANKCATCMHDYMGIGHRKLLAKILLQKIGKKNPLVDTAKESLKKYRKSKRVNQALATPPAPPSKRQNRVLIIGWYGTETLGDKAILGGLIHCIEEAYSNVKIDVAAIEKYVTQQTKRQMSDLSEHTVLSLAEARQNAQQGDYDIVMFGGGPLMSSVDRIIDMLEIVSDAKSKGSRFMVSGSGIGPINDKEVTNNKAIQALLNLADSIFVRDEKSKKVAQETFNSQKDITVILDPSFIWLNKEKQKSEGKLTVKKQILFAIRDWPMDQYGFKYSIDEARKIKSTFEGELNKFLVQLNEAFPEHRLIPFCMNKITVGGDDRAFYRTHFSELPFFLDHLDNYHQKPIDDFNLFLESELVIAMRFHGSVFGFASGRPTLGIDYTCGGKIKALYEQFDLKDQRFELEDFRAQATMQMLKNRPAGIDMNHLENQVNETQSKLKAKIEALMQ